MSRIGMPSPGILSAAPDRFPGLQSGVATSAAAAHHQPHGEDHQGTQQQHAHGDGTECPWFSGDDLRKKHDVAQYRAERRSGSRRAPR